MKRKAKLRSDLINDYMITNRFNVSEMIRHLKVGQNTYYKFLEGEEISHNALYKIADVLKVDPREIQ